MDSLKAERCCGLMTLKVRDLHVVYGKKTILESIDLDAQAGKLTAIIGPNGQENRPF